MLAFFRATSSASAATTASRISRTFLGASLQSDTTRSVLFACSAAALALGYLVCRYIVTSKLGRVVMAVRDAADRTRFLGYRVEPLPGVDIHPLGGACGDCRRPVRAPGGASSIPANSSRSIPSNWWCGWPLGGRGTLYGAAVGAVIVNYAKTVLTGRPAGSVAVRPGGVVRGGDRGPCRKEWWACGTRCGRGEWRRPVPDAMAAARPLIERRPGIRVPHRETRPGRNWSTRRAARSCTWRTSAVSFDGFRALNELTSVHRKPANCAASSGPTAPARPP